MIVAERNGLISVKILISNALVHLELFENRDGNLFLSSRTSRPEGIVYYATMPSLLNAFLEDSITLQLLFTNSPSHFAEIIEKDKTTLYNLNDADIQLTCGDKTIKQLTNANPLEVWELLFSRDK